MLGSPRVFLPFLLLTAPGLDGAMRRKLQAYVHIYDFLTDEVWSELVSAEIPRKDKIVSFGHSLSQARSAERFGAYLWHALRSVSLDLLGRLIPKLQSQMPIFKG